MKKTAQQAQDLKEFFLRAVDLDTASFDQVMEAFRLPRKTEEQKAAREKAIQEATREATRVPLLVMEKGLEALKLIRVVAENGNKNSISDAAVAALAALTAVEGAYYNVLINLPGITDQQFRTSVRRKAGQIKRRSAQLQQASLKIVNRHLL